MPLTSKCLVVCLAVIFLLIGAHPARAEDPETCRWDQDPKEWDGNQSDLNRCAGIRLQHYDLAMNKLYEEKLAHLASKDSKTQFKSAQAAWLLYRDKACLYESWPMHGGSMEPLVDGLCLATLTQQRIETLQTYLDCTENGCPN